jgi:hypothetical protein
MPGADAARAVGSQRWEELCLLHEMLPEAERERIWAYVSVVPVQRAWR